MEQSLFNFNALTIALSSLPPLSSQSRTIQSYCQGVTRVQLTYKDLFFTISTIFSSINPFKVKLDWDLAKGGDATTVINDVYAYDSAVDPLSTFSPLNSAFSYYVYTPAGTVPETFTGLFTVYYENGVIMTFNNIIYMSPDNVIDLDLNIIDIQNTYYKDVNIYNISSSKGDVVYNHADY